MAKLHLIKLSVGSESIHTQAAWQAERLAEGGGLRHVTRMWPRREDELLAGGSIFWVIKGVVQSCQKIIRLDEVIGEDGIRRCGIVLDPQLFHTRPQPRRPFQGWRYLEPSTAPEIGTPYQAGEKTLPANLKAELAALGVL
ncbi:MAG: DUF1489 domain-containing protein [Rhodobacteraceae bacterium]|nr:DUF1489 domain-containing protein [Paracoccaceae bacterium]